MEARWGAVSPERGGCTAVLLPGGSGVPKHPRLHFWAPPAGAVPQVVVRSCSSGSSSWHSMGNLQTRLPLSWARVALPLVPCEWGTEAPFWWWWGLLSQSDPSQFVSLPAAPDWRVLCLVDCDPFRDQEPPPHSFCYLNCFESFL